MTVSPLADMGRDIPALDRWSRRESPITGFGIHHNAGVDAYGQATAAGREVSANYWITNAGVILPNVDEDYRAFTSGMAGYPAGAAADHRNITVEVSNSPEGVRSGSWAISDRAEAALAALIGDVYRRYGLGPVRRGADRGVGLHRDWVPTECPGPYIVGNIDRIIHSAELARVGGASPVTVLGEDMYHFIVENKHQFTVSDGKIHHLGTTGQADIVPRVIGKTHKITKAEFDEFLQAADVPLDVYRWSDGAVLDPQAGQFMRNGTWSRSRQLLGVQGVADHRGKK